MRMFQAFYDFYDIVFVVEVIVDSKAIDYLTNRQFIDKLLVSIGGDKCELFFNK